jgi:hypothetical protein
MIVRLTGGLGNQLFQYAFGRSMAISREESVKFHWSKSCWDYALDKYNVKVDLVDEASGPYYDEQTFAFDEGAEYANQNCFRGYWQTEKYFLGSVIRKEITLKIPPSALTVGVGDMLSEVNSVSIHVRRGDYLNLAYHGILPMEYYNRAIRLIEAMVQNPRFFVFSDDPKWCKTAFPNAEVLSFQGCSQHDDLYLMSRCKHAIIANSSFSWWGAWLSEMNQLRRIVIAPEKWFGDDTKQDTSDIIPDRWIKI